MARHKMTHKICHESFIRKLLEDILFQKQKVTNQNVNNNKKGTSAILKETGEINLNIFN